MPQSTQSLMVGHDHAVPVQPAGGSAVVTVQSGSSVVYGDNPQVSATKNQGTIVAGGSQTFTSPAWIVSAGLAAVQIAVTPFSIDPTVAGNLPAVPGISSIVVYGDSLSSAVGVSSEDFRSSAMLAGLWGAEEVNRALGGAVIGWDDTSSNPGGVSFIAQKERRYRTHAPYRTPHGLCKLAYGTNDLVTLGQVTTNATTPTAQGQAIFKNGYRTAITLMRSAARFYCGATAATLDSSVVLGGAGVWTAQPAGAMSAGKRGLGAISGSDGYRSNPTSAATVTITIPGDYPGSASCPLYVMFVADPTLTAGTITASGAATGTFDLFQNVGGKPGTCDNTRTGGGQKNLIVWRFTGSAIPAAAGGQTQTLTLTSSGVTGGPWGFAEWGVEAEQPPTVLLRSIPYGDPFGGFYSNVSTSDVDAWNVTLQSLPAEFDTYVRNYDITSLLGGTGGLNAPHSTLNGAITNVSPANGGTLALNNAANAAGFAASGAVLVSPGAPGGEYIAYTGVASGNLTGITRGAYGSVAQAWSNSTAIGQSAAALVQNWGDGLHLSEKGHMIEADTMRQALTALLEDGRANTYRTGRGRVEARWKLGCSQDQICDLGQQQALIWDQQISDTANMHSPGGVVGRGAGVANAPPTAGSAQVVIRADGHYVGKVFVTMSAGKHMSSGANGLTGIRKLFLFKNDLRNTIAETTFFPAFDDLNIFIVPSMCLTWDDELRAGDVLWAALFCQYSSANDYHGVSANAPASTTLNGAINNAVTTVTVTSGTGIVNNDYLRCDDEIMLVTAGGGTASLTVTRGQLGSAAAAHLTAANIYSGQGITRNTLVDRTGATPIFTGVRVSSL